MRTRLPVALAAASALALGASAAAATAAPRAAGSSGADRAGYIVVLKDSAAPGKVAREHSERHGAAVGHVYRHALKGYSAQMSPVAAARIADDRRVQYVQEDGVVSIAKPGGGTGKPSKPGGGGGSTGQTVPTGIDRVDAEGKSLPAGVDVAVIDTGVDLDHPDLTVNRTKAVNCSSGSSADDGNGHGTHVAGTIGALNNTIGVVGVAPGATIWPVRVLNNAGSGTFSSIICGVDFVTANASSIEVANMSLGGSGTASPCVWETDRNGVETVSTANNDAMHEAICKSVKEGVTYVVAAGNSSEDAAGHVPAAYAEVITVSALADFDGKPGGLNDTTVTPCRSDVDDTFADFSNYGAVVDLIAPGVCIKSTWKGGGYNTISGTSMASPHVAGGAALYMAKHGRPTPAGGESVTDVVKAALKGSGTLAWDNTDDGDRTKEELLNVATY